MSSILAIWASHQPGQLARKGDYSFLSFLKQICEFVPSLRKGAEQNLNACLPSSRGEGKALVPHGYSVGSWFPCVVVSMCIDGEEREPDALGAGVNLGIIDCQSLIFN